MPSPRARACVYLVLFFGAFVAGYAAQATADQRSFEQGAAICRQSDQIASIERRIEQLDIEKRMTRLEIQLAEARDDIGDIKRVGAAIGVAIAGLFVEMLARLLGIRSKG